MTVYATAQDLEKRLGDLFQTLYFDSETPLEDLRTAQSEIDAVLSVRYRVPVASEKASALLKGWTLTLAEELAYVRSGGGKFPEHVRDRVTVVRANLRMAAEGRLMIDGAPATPAQGIAAETVIVGESPVFIRAKMKGF